jgi:hypothetical protein
MHMSPSQINTVNVFTGFLPFQLQMGHSPHLIPPILNVELPLMKRDLNTCHAMTMLEHITFYVTEAKDHLLTVKVSQAHFVNQHRAEEVVYAVGDKVMLSTEHHCCKYMQAYSGRVAKFMP